MARHILRVRSSLGGVVSIPAPAVDMVSNQTRFGASGTYVSGGGYVRRTTHGGQVLNVSWNNLRAEDIVPLRVLDEGGVFWWDNPFAHPNLAPPWLGTHVFLDELAQGYLGVGARSYLLDKFDGIENPRFAQLSGQYIGYGAAYAVAYDVDRTGGAILQLPPIPLGYEYRVWAVGSATGNARLILNNTTIPLGTPTSYGVELPTNYYSTVVTNPRATYGVQIVGTGTLTLASLQIRVVPAGSPVDLTYSPGLGNTGMEFSEEGLSLVQHSAALDQQSATATWIETGWWK